MEEIDNDKQVYFDYIGININHVDGLIKIYKSLSDKITTIGIVKEETPSNLEADSLSRLKQNILTVCNTILEGILEEEEPKEDNIIDLTLEDIIEAITINPNISIIDKETSIEYFFNGEDFDDSCNNHYTLKELKNIKWKIQN